MMMLALISITTAGYGRWLTRPILSSLEHLGLSASFLTFWLAFNVAPILRTGIIALRDVVVYRQLVPAFVWGTVIMTCVQLLPAWLNFLPEWKALAERWEGG